MPYKRQLWYRHSIDLQYDFLKMRKCVSTLAGTSGIAMNMIDRGNFHQSTSLFSFSVAITKEIVCSIQGFIAPYSAQSTDTFNYSNRELFSKLVSNIVTWNSAICYDDRQVTVWKR